jgi:hypothetical protein
MTAKLLHSLYLSLGVRAKRVRLEASWFLATSQVLVNYQLFAMLLFAVFLFLSCTVVAAMGTCILLQVRVYCEYPCSWVCSAVKFSACGLISVYQTGLVPMESDHNAVVPNQRCPSCFVSFYPYLSQAQRVDFRDIFAQHISDTKVLQSANALTQLAELSVGKARTENLLLGPN